ncbi:MAG: RHS repeat-associated core domain-containing protein [Verrucomicrobiales bacterium]|nr:RHS repeat-associated core domain-containing protein [Verrucomicrobiales bacterium]
MNEHGYPHETYPRGVGLAGDPADARQVPVTPRACPNAGTYYTHHNHCGDIISARRGTTTVGNYSYSASGSLQSAIGPDLCRFKFSSKERDPSTGFSYYGYRFYAPAWQRWTSTDPITEKGGYNLYSFVANRPLAHLDTLGQKILGISAKR